MQEILKISTNNFDICYDKLKSHDRFIYHNDAGFEFFAIKYNNDYSIVVDGEGMFTILFRDGNSLKMQVGEYYGWIREFKTFDNAVDCIKGLISRK